MCAIFAFGTSTMSRHHHAQSMQDAAGVDCCGRSHLISFRFGFLTLVVVLSLPKFDCGILMVPKARIVGNPKK